MPASPVDPVRALTALDGRATWRELRAVCTRHAIDQAVARHRIVRPRRGLYALPDLPPARAAAASLGGVLSHVSAAVELGLAVLVEPPAVHVTVPAAVDARRGSGRRALRRVVDASDDRAANPFESALRAVVLDAGLAGFVPQQPVRLPNGRTVHVDLGDATRRVALEADSFAHHASRQTLRDDCRRYDALVLAGWLVLRFAWEHVLFDAAWVAGVVSGTCALRPSEQGAEV